MSDIDDLTSDEEKESESSSKVSFFAKDETVCPVCEEKFRIEKMLSGRGRLNAGKLTDELRRLYIPTPKYGSVNPLYYVVITCPNCFYSTYEQDFKNILPSSIEILRNDIVKRKKFVYDSFGPVDFKKERKILEGLVSLVMAQYTYAFFPQKVAPTTKIAISSLRAAWLASDLEEEKKEKFFGELKNILYKKAYNYYSKAYSLLNSGKENIEAAGFLGPDLDKNYGFNGFLFIYGVLLYKYGLSDIQDDSEKIRVASDAKAIIGRIFGSGRSSRDKNVQFLDMAKELYEKYSKFISSLEKK
ncbi:MAG: DUF2225 domain-containing protein [Spirochaetales bacterium]|jgi:uncharacterized protein (DUF2225 family)|nr:DUF2225 domain-containing protein [Exilispira sp.]NMC67179.1 DUF2225 domain-containing protein [Spirochaetales bacterium]